MAEYVPVPFGYFRMLLYTLAGLKMEKGVTIEYGMQIGGNFENIYLKENVEIAQGVYLHAYDRIVIGKNTAIAPFVKIITNQNPRLDVNKLNEFYTPFNKPVVIEDNVYIGTGAIILPGVTVHEMSVVGAGAVVTKDVPSFTVVAGVPARVVKNLAKKEIICNE
ncbi:MAG: galactoside-O-acetyltransferase [Candidatus Methanoperedens nitroreducens]|uniref:Galactoside-O-acetyltransferase n=1 Tax=Candidatus Methanoperedens nitratireducens TaxID=1392998 RepID=A0A0P8A1L6_9EURY|nr:MAG: galactoside-O-acetyltransferase [Candidatus Methanoperedens sp. BLZ1]